MRQFVSLLLIAAIAFTTQAQKKIIAATYANTITEDSLKRNLYIIADKDFEGRETATEGQRKAALYIENYFRSLGLQPGYKGSYQLPYPVYQDSLLTMNITVNNESFHPYTDFEGNISLNHSETLLTSQIVFAGYGISDSLYDDYKGVDVKGKIVMVLHGEPPGQLQSQIDKRMFNPFGKQDAAQLHGASGLLIIQEDFPRKPIADKGSMYLDGFKKTNWLNTFYISPKIATAIMGDDYTNIKNGHVQPKIYNSNIHLSFNKATAFLQSSDVLGYLEGSDLKDQLVVISAHYDHLGKRDSVIFYGADDDGSGTVGLMEIAAAFVKAKAAGNGPRRSILFLANSGEEEGLWGSEYYVSHPAYPLDKTTVNLNMDMIGRIDPGRKYGDSINYVYVVGDDKLSSDLHTISVAMNRKYTKLELDYKFNDPKDPERIYYRSDHYNFALKGVPIIFYFDGVHKDYHKPTDTPDKINYDLMLKRTQLVFYTAWDMANRDDMLKRDKPLGKE